MLSSLYGSSRDIDNVLVDGRFLKQDGKLTTIDMAETLSAPQDRVISIIDKFFKEHPEQKKNGKAKCPIGYNHSMDQHTAIFSNFHYFDKSSRMLTEVF